MNMKNKLVKHHKNKMLFYVRNFSFVFAGLLGVGLTIAIPTYISSIQESRISAKAESEKPAAVEEDVYEELLEEYSLAK